MLQYKDKAHINNKLVKWTEFKIWNNTSILLRVSIIMQPEIINIPLLDSEMNFNKFTSFVFNSTCHSNFWHTFINQILQVLLETLLKRHASGEKDVLHLSNKMARQQQSSPKNTYVWYKSDNRLMRYAITLPVWHRQRVF